MLKSQRIAEKYNYFNYRVWKALRDHGISSVAELAKDIICKDSCVKANHRQRIRNACSELVAGGDAERVGRGVYRINHKHKKRSEHYSFNEKIAAYVMRYGRVHFSQITSAFKPKSEKAVRSALDRIRRQGVISKDGKYWCWMGNVVQLSEPKKVAKTKKEQQRRKEYWPDKPEKDDDPSTWDDDDERWDTEYQGEQK